MTLLRRSLVPLLLLTLTGCVVPSEGSLADSDAVSSGPADAAMSWSVLEGEPAYAWSTQPRGLIEAPSEVLAFVGQDLTFDVYAVDPTLGRIAAGALPTNAVFEYDELGGSLHWSLEVEDVGHHVLVFLLMDAAEPDLVLAQTSVAVAVLPVNKLIEYGF